MNHEGVCRAAPGLAGSANNTLQNMNIVMTEYKKCAENVTLIFVFVNGSLFPTSSLEVFK